MASINSILPPETLLEIFLIGRTLEWVLGDIWIHGWGRGWSSPGPLASWQFSTAVSHVCSQWRNLALDHPNLWTHMIFGPELHTLAAYCSSICNELDDHAVPKPRFKRAITWLRRSKSLPIHIRIEAYDGRDDYELDLLFQCLRPSVHRWQSLEFDGILVDAITYPLASFPPAEMLKSLTMRENLYEDCYGPEREAAQLFSGHTPNLTSVRTNGPLCLPWNCNVFQGLSKLDMVFNEENRHNTRDHGDPSTLEFLSILTACPRLVELRFHG